MGTIADAVLAEGGEAIGVIPEHLGRREVAHSRMTKLEVVGSMHERKALMERLSDGFIAMPGGFGTMDEFCEIMTWMQLACTGSPAACSTWAAITTLSCGSSTTPSLRASCAPSTARGSYHAPEPTTLLGLFDLHPS